MTEDLTTGSVWKTLIRFSVPFLLSYFLQTLYGMADLYIIGRFYGTESTTAVSVGSQVMHMITVMIVGLAMGTVVTVGQATGSGNRLRVSKAVGNTATLFLSLSLLLTAVLLFMVRPIVWLVSTPEAAAAETKSYLTICFLGIPFITAYNIAASVFRGLGDSRRPLYFVGAACLSNIALDYLFIGGLRLGAAGAALGTVFSQAFSVLVSLLYIRSGKNRLCLCRSDFRPSGAVMREILKIGIPVALQDGFIQVGFLLITVFANQRGLEDAAAVGIVEKLICILFLVPSALLQSVSALAAVNLGARKPERARLVLRYSCILAVVWGLAVALLMHLGGETVLGWFSESRQVVRLGCQYLRGYVWDCLFAGIHFSCSGYFCACGVSMLSFLHNALSIVCVRIPWSYYAARMFPDTLFPMGLASPAGSALSVLICVLADLWLRHRQPRTETEHCS